MATLTATYTRAFAQVSRHEIGPVLVGSAARSEVITMPATGTMLAVAGEDIVSLVADADAWVAIGATPDVTAADGVRAAHKLISGVPYQFAVSVGDTIDVEAA